ncbi:MAG: M2 family metallopeptidase [Vicinamibacterales bacterium]|jgi:peptidyl-dipeptidase A|nr:peptidase M3 [Acidobacteriota bacterium]MDP6371274.1 M2 family metallopeptidase [Vicinamibacterales bacterium]MDP6608321.1 M2 family metallopeptidase [Vicinamibacterales bacterium]HAK56198.1 peptidase M3 [Acidobacteriota bacterium]|tara:strand:+ start:4954 stop:6570 length:1617 start_codon:yes stop_codon:yes gene_type:complete
MTGTADTRAFTGFLSTYLDRYRPLHLESSYAWWDANVTGSDEAFARKARAEAAIIELQSDRAVFADVERFRDAGLDDPVLRRQADVLYRTFLGRQADPGRQKRIVAIENSIEQTFNTHRSTVDGRSLTENEVREVLSGSEDSRAVEAAWKGYMAVGAEVADRVREVVELRNTIARELGYANYFAMALDLQEVDVDALLRLFDQLDDLTRAPFAALKDALDARMADRFGLAPAALRPWHFGDLFFQEAIGQGESGLDAIFQDRDLTEVARAYYASLGMPVEAVLARSDLYERDGKSPHAFAVDLDRAGDVRILCNLKPSTRWMDTLLHELGHAVYDVHLDADLPFVLKEASSAITTEGIAMMMGSMAKNGEFLVRGLGVAPSEAARLVAAARQSLAAEKLIFSRWAQVVVRFEHAMYAGHDGDLGALWWELKQRYQLLPPPDRLAPDYAAKVHIAVYPAYYQSYVMGDLFGTQLRHHLAETVAGGADPAATCFYDRTEAGAYLRDAVFALGNRHPWHELTERCTGSPLSAEAFASLYVS